MTAGTDFTRGDLSIAVARATLENWERRLPSKSPKRDAIGSALEALARRGNAYIWSATSPEDGQIHGVLIGCDPKKGRRDPVVSHVVTNPEPTAGDPDRFLRLEMGKKIAGITGKRWEHPRERPLPHKGGHDVHSRHHKK